MFTFATHAVRGNAAPTRTPTVCSDSTSRREPTCRYLTRVLHRSVEAAGEKRTSDGTACTSLPSRHNRTGVIAEWLLVTRLPVLEWSNLSQRTDNESSDGLLCGNGRVFERDGDSWMRRARLSARGCVVEHTQGATVADNPAESSANFYYYGGPAGRDPDPYRKYELRPEYDANGVAN